MTRPKTATPNNYLQIQICIYIYNTIEFKQNFCLRSNFPFGTGATANLQLQNWSDNVENKTHPQKKTRYECCWGSATKNETLKSPKSLLKRVVK